MGGTHSLETPTPGLENDYSILFLDFVVYDFVCHYNWHIKDFTI